MGYVFFLWMLYECTKFSSLQESSCPWTFTECHQPPGLQESHTKACSCVSIDPSHSCCSFFSERLHFVSCGTFHHFVTCSPSCCSFPKPFCFKHPYNQLRPAQIPNLNLVLHQPQKHVKPWPQMPSRYSLAHPGRPTLKTFTWRMWQILVLTQLRSSLVIHQGRLTTHKAT